MIRVLLVDDEPALLDIGKIFLERTSDMQVEPVTNASEALELLSSEPFDAIVSDYEMPGINGIDVLKAIKTAHPLVEVIMLTGL